MRASGFVVMLSKPTAKNISCTFAKKKQVDLLNLLVRLL
jgi:hypothetical protein